MSKHLIDVLMTVCYYGFILYMCFIEISYFYFRSIKKDIRFEKVKFFKYFECPVKTLRGEFK